MKIVFEMNDDTFRDIDCLILSQDSTKAYYFDEIVENCVPLSEVLDKIRSEVTAIAINGQVDEHTMFIRTGEQVKQMALGIINKYLAEGSNKE